MLRDGVVLLIKLLLRIMCGRYSSAGTLDELAEMVSVFACHFVAARHNVAPRQQAPVLVLENDQPVMKLMRRGLIPGRAKDESIGDYLINARAEKTSSKKPFELQRCLVAAMLVTQISSRR